jgi:predicted P-loop ATPase
MVGSLLDEKMINQTMLVLTGKQGIGKTSWLLDLVPEQLKSYVFSGTINPDNKDTLIYLSECMLLNLDELENLNKHQLGSIKEMITKNQVHLRRPYGTIFENLVRRTSFAGSVNNRDFLNDTSGNRRFLCFEVSSINYRHDTDLNLVYSHALEYFRSGFRFWFEPDEIELINQNNEKFRIISLEEQQLFKRFGPCGKAEATDLLSSSEILHIIFEENRNLINDVSLQRLGKILTASRFIKTKRIGRQRYYLKRQGQNAGGYPTQTLMEIDV